MAVPQIRVMSFRHICARVIGIPTQDIVSVDLGIAEKRGCGKMPGKVDVPQLGARGGGFGEKPPKRLFE